MKCPRCSLVHAPGEEVCRRCEVDLRTGQPRSRAHCSAAAAAPPSLVAKVKGYRARMPSLPRRTRETKGGEAPSSATARPVTAAGAKPKAGIIAMARKPRDGLLGRLKKYRKQNGVKQLTCLQCSGPMTLNRKAPFSAGAPIALLILAGVLLVAGIKFHLLFLPAPLALGLGIFYLRIGRTSWKCASCGFTIPRFSG